MADIWIGFLDAVIIRSSKYNDMDRFEQSTPYQTSDPEFERFLDEVLPEGLPKSEGYIGVFLRRSTSQNGDVHDTGEMLATGSSRGNARINRIDGRRLYFQSATALILAHEIRRVL